MNGKTSSKNSRILNYSFISENVNAFILKFGKVSYNNKKKTPHSFKIGPAALRDHCLGSGSCDQASGVTASVLWRARPPTGQPDPALSPDRAHVTKNPQLSIHLTRWHCGSDLEDGLREPISL